MKACKHYESLIGRTAQHNPAVEAARPFTFPTVPMIYQEQPKQANGAPILPHRFVVAGREQRVLGGEWSSVDKNGAALAMAEWCHDRYARHTGPIVLNVESIPLDTPDAKAFWATVLDAMRTACPRATFGFYNRPDMPDNVDFLAPSLYPIKRVNADCWADNEHEQTPARYRQVTLANLARYDRTRTGYAFCSLTTNGGEWCTRAELFEQWKLAQDLGLDVIWWGSLATEPTIDTAVRRARKAIDTLAATARATPVLA